MGLLNLLGLAGKSEKILDFKNRGAVIIDVRTPGEFVSGHIKDSKNIPLNTILAKAEEIKKLEKPIIVCCASGMRSAQAASFLKSQGIEVVNGGGWSGLQRKL